MNSKKRDKFFSLLINVIIMIVVSNSVYWLEMFFGRAMWPMHHIVSICFLALMTIHHDLTFFFCAGDHLILRFSHHESKHKTKVTLIIWSLSSFHFNFMILIVVFFSITQTSQPPTTSIPGFLTRHTEVDVELVFLSEMNSICYAEQEPV